MGWKTFMIIIDSKKEIDERLLLDDLGFKNYHPIREEYIETAIYPDEGKLYMGRYKEKLIICESKLPVSFLEKHLNSQEKALNQHFPDSEICTLFLQSVVNGWGYSISKNGEKLRVRLGLADEGTVVDFGEPLEQEKKLLAQSTINDKGQRIYQLEGFDKPFYEDQVGESFVFELYGRYFGEKMDYDDGLFETKLKEYSYQKPDKVKSDDQTVTFQTLEAKPMITKPISPQKPWWKFW